MDEMTHQPIKRQALEARLREDPFLVEISRLLGSIECWVVGGWVRDRALGINPPDLDLVIRGVDAARQAAATLAAAWKTTPRLLGKPEKAVWRIAGPRSKVEIWPMENDDLETDALRRDFTCNALFWRLPEGPLLDFSGGLADISHREIRALSRDNLAADPVRLARAVRLMAALDGFTLESQTRDWIADLASALTEAPRERVGAELLTLARTPGAGHGFRTGSTLGLLTSADPSAQKTTFSASMDALARLVKEERHPLPGAVAENRVTALLAWLASGWSIESPKDLAPFAWPRAIAHTAAIAAVNHTEAKSVVNRGPADRREFIARCGEAFPSVLALAAANDTARDGRPRRWQRWWEQWLRSSDGILRPTPLLTASEVAIISGCTPGPRLGHFIKKLEQATVRRDVRTPAGARRWLLAQKG